MERGEGRRRSQSARKIEWPTWIMLALCYALWGAAVWNYEALGPFLFILVAGYTVGLHASLQHEALHGHPTRSAALNEALVFPSLNLLFPYLRFRDLHLRHHCDERLTDPYDDPESWYLAERDARALSPLMAALLRVNGSLAGRLVIGPWLSVIGLYRADWRQALQGDRGARIRSAYLRHAAGVALVLGYIWGVCGLNPILYLLMAAWPGLSLLMLRTYAEHRAAARVEQRTAVLEAEAPFALLFLNNNLHAVHHTHPTAPWYALPTIWRREREATLARNGGYFIRGYRALFRDWLFRRREPLAHPLLRRDVDAPREPAGEVCPARAAPAE